ncbi:hypothetical protein R3X25_00010 [Lutibacter sp. TH_r2]|uniref:hypothetical protein n=1 Tax=Lutibacter sp. TH_r2 TaxID=3082083 RepID=UPI0029548C73|nr:hypothetical protein [Lutibacter sp. TH_r2]MDV7185646.1 hypothetical protein [Lutibacter sp. TH_r2]
MKKSILKLGVFALFMLAFNVVSAQSTADVAKTAEAVRVIDNKGTIKYFQSNNGITQIVNTTNDVTTTTWQLGGTLTDNTYIDASGAEFGITGIEETTLDAATIVDGTGTGYTLLVTNEETGEIQKLLATDLISSGQETLDAAGTETTITATGMPANASQVWVYRNGAKLVAGLDYTVTAELVTLVPQTTANRDWTIMAGDFFEVHWIK